jgi:hypothetical protein
MAEIGEAVILFFDEGPTTLARYKNTDGLRFWLGGAGCGPAAIQFYPFGARAKATKPSRPRPNKTTVKLT